MDESYKPSSEEIEAGEGQMNPREAHDSDQRERGYSQLNKEERGLLKDCDLKYTSDPENKCTIIQGTIKGKEVEFVYSEGDKYPIGNSGTVDGTSVPDSKILDLWRKYAGIAKFQTFEGPTDMYGNSAKKMYEESSIDDL